MADPVALVTPEVAAIDQDREITVALIEAAGLIASLDYNPATNPEFGPTYEKAQAFLNAWWDRKFPKLDLPKFGGA